MLYGCETWTVTKRCESRILSFERKCYRKILRIGWTQKVTNEELYRKIQLTETLLQKVIQRKLRLFGHICRMNDSRKIKTLVFGMMDGSNKRGRPHREWSDDIEQWCGTTLQELSHAALDRQRWAAIVRMASDTNGHWAHGCRWWWWWCLSEVESSIHQFLAYSGVDALLSELDCMKPMTCVHKFGNYDQNPVPAGLSLTLYSTEHLTGSKFPSNKMVVHPGVWWCWSSACPELAHSGFHEVLTLMEIQESGHTLYIQSTGWAIKNVALYFCTYIFAN